MRTHLMTLFSFSAIRLFIVGLLSLVFMTITPSQESRAADDNINFNVTCGDSVCTTEQFCIGGQCLPIPNPLLWIASKFVDNSEETNSVIRTRGSGLFYIPELNSYVSCQLEGAISNADSQLDGEISNAARFVALCSPIRVSTVVEGSTNDLVNAVFKAVKEDVQGKLEFFEATSAASRSDTTDTTNGEVAK